MANKEKTEKDAWKKVSDSAEEMVSSIEKGGSEASIKKATDKFRGASSDYMKLVSKK